MGTIISGPLQTRVIKRCYMGVSVGRVGGTYVQAAYLRNFTIHVVNSPAENLANVQKDCL